jgi:LPS sulfotransferase NodH
MVRFVVVCHARTGSTLLVDAVGQHPQAKVWGELFTLDLDARRAHAMPDEPFTDGEDGAAYLDRLFAAAEREGFAAAGFKLMLSHGRTGAASTLWRYLAERRDIRVIFLRRRDLLACFVSLQIASRTQRWHAAATDDVVERTEPEVVDPEALARYFGFIADRWRDVEALFAHHPQLAVEYERDLCHAFAPTMQRVLRFLDLPEFKPRAGYRKLEQRDIRERVANYDELARRFAATPYARHFSDGEG